MGYSRKKCHRTRVTKLWNQNPNCHWCNVETVRVEVDQQRLDPHSATFDHIYHKSNPLRHTRKGRNLGVLACYACNQKRGRDEHIKSLPAWNRWLIKVRIPIPVWKVRKKVEQIKRKFRFITKKLSWAKRHIKWRMSK